MSMLDDFVEHSAGPSIPPRYSSSGAYRSSATNGGTADLKDVEYEGFEVDDGDAPVTEDAAMVQALETGFIPSSRTANTQLPPLFALSLVQYTPPAAILCLTAANNLLFLAVAPLSIIIIDLLKPDELVTIDLPKPAPDKNNPNSQAKEALFIQRLFADPTARHLLITTNSGDTFYLPISPGNAAVQSRRPRPLRLRQTITAVGWSPISGQSSADGSSTDNPPPAKGDAITPPSTDVLLGTASGQILSLPLPPQDDIFKAVSISMSRPLERDLQTVYTLAEPRPITGIVLGFWPATTKAAGKKDRRAWVVFTTKERVFEVQGDVSTTVAGGKGGGWAEEVFKPVRESTPKFQELPGDPPSSELRAYLPTSDSQSASSIRPPSAIAWLTSPGLYTSPVPSTPNNDILSKPSLLPYPPPDVEPTPAFSRQAPTNGPSTPRVPISISITQWHWLLLYPDRIIGVSRENEKVVWDEMLPLVSTRNLSSTTSILTHSQATDERAKGLSADPVSKTFWIFTDRSILEVLVRVEDRDVWRAKLEKDDFTEALKYVRTAAQKDVVLSRQGDAYFEQARFIQAAQCYAQSSRSFEYVALRFVDADERDALRVYLSDRLDLLDKRDRTQRMMLATWLVEIYLSKCNTLEDIISAESATSDVESLTIEREMMEEDMRNFVTTYQNDLEPKVVYELILSHGRTDLYLFYANLKKDHGKVVEHWVTEEQWLKAIDVLNRQSSVDLYYRFASILMRHAPRETVDSWLRQSALSPRRLIPAMLQQNRPGDTTAISQAIRYLNHVVFQQNSTDTTIHNLLLTFHASSPDPDDGPLLRFLQSCPDDPITERPYYDLDYALRLCKQHGRVQPCVHIYSKMGLYESSVDLALEKGDLELAKINADRPDDDEPLRKKLWLKIAKYVVQEQKDIKSAMKFLESTDLVKIEDILPFFPDFVVIDDFKAEICSALEDYSARIEELRQEMEEATQSAESIKRDIQGLANRFVTVDQGDKCWKCGLGLVTRQFYVFPCQHTFHADCLIQMVMEFLPAPALRRILHLQTELVSRPSEASRALLSSTLTPGGSGTATPRNFTTGPTSGSTTTDLLLGVTGRNKLLAAGDRLRELIIPDALAQAVSAVNNNLNVVGGGGGGDKKRKASKKERDRDDARADEARAELDTLVAGVCPLCEQAVVGIDKGFVKEGEDVRDWEV
ncbi:Pep3/Vps18/deep orange family-domain-containing protein [Naematelia encephala]|uniref:Pep3/Vps18/deep orange family-domain-containing protein n=1 Tax=Naematelia encephala TaxID=71784 RepID=A0A1Y2B445_9TREE|nr:Pep3/Vps18/deep orange family-domain-containing protein [Naematelia encephala]